MSDSEFPLTYREIQRVVYRLMYASDKADFLSKVYLNLISHYREETTAGTLAPETKETIRLISNEIDHYRAKSLGEHEPDVVPRKGRPKRPRADERIVDDRQALPEGFISTDEAAKITMMKRDYLLQLARDKNLKPRLKSHKVGRRVLFRSSELYDWMEKRAEADAEPAVTEREALQILKRRMSGKK